jgi:hypothetical protein
MKRIGIAAVVLIALGTIAGALLLITTPGRKLIYKARLAIAPKVEPKIKEVIKEVEVIVKPDPPEKFVSYKSIDTTQLWSGLDVTTKFEFIEGRTATEELATEGNFGMEVKVKLTIPKANDSVESLAGLNPSLPAILPALPQLLENGKVSPLYNVFYEVKAKRMQDRITRLNSILTKHNFYDCETILELSHPETKAKAFLMQGEMDVVSDGSDGDRRPELDEYIANSDNYQPFSSYGWAKRTQQPNPLLSRWEQKVATAKAAQKPNKALIEELTRELNDLKARSYLIARDDPFIVIPLSLLGYTKKNPHAPAIGDYAVVIHEDKIYPAICGDAGPSFQMGEASLRLAKEIDENATPYRRPVSKLAVTYIIFPGSGERPWGPPDLPKWHQRVSELLTSIGGIGQGFTLHQWEDHFAQPINSGETGN